MDIVKLVKEGKAYYEFKTVVSKHNDYELEIKVFRDAMKFNNVPNLKYNRNVTLTTETRNGVRLPASAYELQEIADLLSCMLMTPKVIDLIWLQAELKLDSIVNINGHIVATCNIEWVHDAIENKIKSLGGDDGSKLVSCVGKYWCLINALVGAGKLHGAWIACNYGWCGTNASGPGITPGVKCWQRPGFRHRGTHLDPSQTIRLMHRMATLKRPDGTSEEVDLHDLAADPELAPLLHHEGVLKYLRQKGPEQLEPLLDLSFDPDMWSLGSKDNIS